MKKKIGIISVLLVIVIVVILAILLTKKENNKSINLDNGIAYYYQNGSGYTQGTSSTWTTGYVLNVGKSSCNGTTNPKDILNWDLVNKTVLMSADKNNNCKLYFDKAYTATEFFTTFAKNVSNGELIQHTTSLSNSAGDNGYRYSGNNPNNFICFGPGSENYNKGVLNATCPNENLYRIIGYIPVELPDGTTTNLIKVIKSEFATASDLGKTAADGTVTFNSEYKDLIRVKNAENIDGFHWNDRVDNTWDNTWETSTLYKALNTNNNSFIKSLGNWANKIENVKWNVDGYDKNPDLTPKQMHDVENNKNQGASVQVNAKIGLMYPSDLGFASSQDNWKRILNYGDGKEYNGTGYSSKENSENNWLVNGVDEWTISRKGDLNCDAFHVRSWHGYLYSSYVTSAYGVRPVFYLNSSITLSDGDGIDGSVDKPYRVN